MKTDYPFLGQGRIMKTQTQTQTQRTPGPWYVAKTGNVMDKRQCRVATIEQMPGQNEHEQEANAALIAAAPAMLEALRDAANAHAYIDEEYPCGICEVNRRPQWLEDVENAIAAAENLPTG